MKLAGPKLRCSSCGYQNYHALVFERHEIWPNVWKWICLPCVNALGLNEGK